MITNEATLLIDISDSGMTSKLFFGEWDTIQLKVFVTWFRVFDDEDGTFENVIDTQSIECLVVNGKELSCIPKKWEPAILDNIAPAIRFKLIGEGK